MAKKIMCFIFTLNCILLILCSYYYFSGESYSAMLKGYNQIQIDLGDTVEMNKIEDVLFTISSELESDIFICKYNNNINCLDYYITTNKDYVKVGAIKYEWSKNTVYSSNPQYDEKTLYGFFPEGNIRLLPLSLIDNSLNSQFLNFYIEKNDEKSFVEYCNNNEIECSVINGVGINDFISEWNYILFIFILFHFISVVFYAFAMDRDTIIKKSFGWPLRKIVFCQIFDNIVLFSAISGITLIVTFVFFSFIVNVGSAFIFSIVVLVSIVFLIIVSVLFLMFSFTMTYLKSNISDLKGKNQKRDVFYVTVFFRIVIFLLLLNQLTQLDLFQTLDEIQNLRKSESQISDYFTLRIRSFEEYDSKYEIYADKFLNAYREFEKEDALLVTNLRSTVTNDSLITVNENYIDFCEDLKSIDNDIITSDFLDDGKLNYLIPSGKDMSDYISILTRNSSENINIIYYNSDYSFNLLSNSEDGKLVNNVILEVINPEYYRANESDKTIYEMFSALFSNSIFLKYNSMYETSYKQVISVLTENNIEDAVYRAPFVNDVIGIKIQDTKKFLYESLFIISIYIFAFVVLIIYSANLYCSCYINDISIKLMNGYSVLQIFTYKLLMNLALIPLLLFAERIGVFKEYLKINDIYIIIGVVSEVSVYYMMIKYQSMKNMHSLIKGA